MSSKYLLIAAIIFTNLGTYLYCTVDRAAEASGIRYGYGILCTEISWLSSEFVKSFNENGDWPDQGSYETTKFKYVTSRFDTVKDERVDVYLVDVDGGTRVDVNLNQTGEIDVRVRNQVLHN